LKTLKILLLFLVLPLALYSQVSSNQPTRLLIIDHVVVIDSTADARKHDVSVVIVGDKIQSIRPYSPAKRRADAVVVDATGKFLIAGLWDMHVHTLSKDQPDHFFPLFLANGVTGIRDMGGDFSLKEIAQLKSETKSGSGLGPEIYAAGPILEGEHPFWPFSVSVKDQAAAHRAVSQLVGEGADFLKVYNTLSRDAYLSIASQAKEARISFVGHIPDSVTPAEASDLGQKSIEHLWGISPFVSSNPEQLKRMSAEANDADDPKIARDLFYQVNQSILSSYDPKKADVLFKKFVHNDTWQTPTLVVLRSYASIHDPSLREDPRNAYMPDDLRKFWESMGGAPDPRNDEIQLRLFARDIEIVKAMHSAGVSLLAGTDTPNPYTYPGFSLHEELQLLVTAGLSPMEALRTATLRAAEFLGVQRDFGSVEEGKVANLVLLDANPLDDIRNTQKIRAVILRGKFLGRENLDALLAKEKESVAH
jgi:hypothetical protein